MSTPPVSASLKFIQQCHDDGLTGLQLLELVRQLDHRTCSDGGVVAKFIADLAVQPYSVYHVMVSIIVLVNYIDSLGYPELFDIVDDMRPRILTPGYIVQTADFEQATTMVDVLTHDKDFNYMVTLYKLIHELAVESLKIE